MSNTSRFDFNTIIKEIGKAGQEISELGSVEGSAGNISVFVRELYGFDHLFKPVAKISLPVISPALSKGWIIFTGTGKRMRDIAQSPETTLCAVQVENGGEMGMLYAADPHILPTIEYNSHLAVHNYHVDTNSFDYHAIVHAQPLDITYLSHKPEYDSTLKMTLRLIRWEPETICVFPEGIGIVPFQVPGTSEQMIATLEMMKIHRLVVWQRHGTVSRSNISVLKAGDLVEYAEAAARFEMLNLQLGKTDGGLTDEEILRVCKTNGVTQSFIN
ncbi:MAG: class II aldolase/adducin family protein [Chloroflexota bacterium]